MKGEGAGRELSQSPFGANVLFIMRVSEISCEVVEKGPKGRSEDKRGDERTPNILMCDFQASSSLQAPVSALHKARPVLLV